ncbi:9-O-acetyl-N-acetylneuraminate esterase [Lachnoclostridium sp. An169]|uniref:AAA-like domain-containing protein n=1 Tax=Lachnoclostridium sp. An169 TaxID=1965569 RepID=UPI000B38502A|nr:AAA-like domain-containing protein [Lachnoclostridium sp. An169]OUP80862.1 9-O-acetyl-N-acetylneuraminate esterase [Lachnoclostridium sp. An169]
MAKIFNVTGACDPQLHYMVDIRKRLEEIRALVDAGAYFTINRARQYGKTTTLNALSDFLKNDYIVISLDFQLLSSNDFENETAFANAFAAIFVSAVRTGAAAKAGAAVKTGAEMKLQETDAFTVLEAAADAENISGLRKLFVCLSQICAAASKPLVLMIDEVDSAANNQVFLDFLAQLRAYYLTRKRTPTFQSVILAGVYDVKNIQMKIRPDAEHKVNSPWNIAADFDVVMSFSAADIAGMLEQYENDHHTGMDVEEMAEFIYDYTCGYPYLVSRICKLLDEKIAGSGHFPDETSAWTRDGALEAVKLLISEKNTLFDSLTGKLYDYPVLRNVLYRILFAGEKVVYNPDEQWLDMAVMLGFLKIVDGNVAIANRIFEVRLYNYFLTTNESQNSEIFKAAARNKTQYIRNGHLDMETVLAKYVEHFDSIYGDAAEPFSEEEGRRRFLLYLRPIINGTGNYYIEAETRNARRMDIVVDYLGEQFIIELKIWRGNAYNERGEKQLADYLDYFHLKKGYMLSYNFGRNKEIGVKKIPVGDRVLVEAVV